VTDVSTGRATALDGVVWASGALAVGSALLAVGHMGVEIPLVSALGPGGSRPVWPAAIAFAVATGLHGAVCYGVARRRGWAWPLGVLVGAVTQVGATTPLRGAGSVIGIVRAAPEGGLLRTSGPRRSKRGRATS
jgi:hypothetical protein